MSAYELKLAQGQVPEGKITSVTMLGTKGPLSFTQSADGLKVNYRQCHLVILPIH